MSGFVNLHNHTEFSTLDGAINVDELINFAEENDQPAIAATDHGVMGNFYKFLKKTEDKNLKPIIGVELYMVKDIDFPENREKGEKEQRYHLLALAKNRDGLKNLFKLTTEAHKNFYYKPRANMEMIEKYKEDVIFSSACVAGPLSQLILNGKKDLAFKQAKKFKRTFEDFYIEIMPHTFQDQKFVNPRLVEIAKKANIPLIATADSHYLEEESESHPVLLGIGSGGDMWEFSGKETYYPMTGGGIKKYFAEYHPDISQDTIENAISNTLEIANKVEKMETKEKFKIIPKPFPELETKEEELEKLKELIDEGWEKKGMLDKKDDPEYQERLQHELDQIKELDFVRYFLVIYDMYENFVKPNNIMWGTGRGSSASSLVCCLLDITTPDPIKHNLLFSRFINPNRVNMPDIDTDFEDRRRDEIKEWIKEKYGEKNTADIVTYGHMKGKQVLRDVGRVFDIPKKDIDKISNFIIQRDQGDARRSQTVEDSFKEFEECKRFDEKYPEVLPHVKNLEGRIRQKGTHAAGVISAPFPLTEKMPLERQGGKDGEMVTALEGKECESLGFMKFDILGLKTLSVIKDAISQITLTEEDIGNNGVEIELKEPKTMARKDLVNLDYNNPEVLDAFDRGDTEGVFQFNSVGMSDTLKEAEINKFEELVALNSLYRPGGMRSGIAHDYIDRMKGEDYEGLHPIYDDITEDTYGLIIYQEQIMQVFGRMANFSAVEVHRMRKKVAKSYGVESMQELEGDFLEGCQENGIDLDMAKDLFAKMVHFGSYAFNRCISGDTVLLRDSQNENTSREITIRQLYKDWNNKKAAGYKYRNQGLKILSYDLDGRIRPKKVKNVYETGKKPVYRMTLEDGKEIKATKDHKFMLEDEEWKKLGNISVNDVILTKGEYEKSQIDYALSGEKNSEYIDGAYLEFLEAKKKALKRSNGRWDKGYPVKAKKVESIEYVGEEQTYDLEMESNRELGRNYIANGMISHNSHAVVYTQIAYWTQWLKVYYPLEFLVASLNNEDDDDDVKELLGELEKQGYKLLMPHINKSNKHFKIEKDNGEKKVRCGLKYIKGIGDKTADEIIKYQPYENEEDIKNRDGINRRTFHKGIRRKLREVDAWNDQYTDRRKKELRKKLAREEKFPFPVLDESIERAREFADYYDADFVDIENIDFGRNHNVAVRGVWSGRDFNRVGDFGDPSKSKFEAGARYVNMDLLDSTAHIRVKFNPKKYQEYKDTGLLDIGNKVLVKGYVIEDVKMIFVSFAMSLSKEKIEEHKEKYGGG